MQKHVIKYYLGWTEGRRADADRIEQHLRNCEKCRKYYDTMTKLLDSEIVSEFPQLIPDPYLPARITAGTEKSRRRFVGGLSPVLGFSFGSLAVLLAVVIGIIIGKEALPASATDASTEMETAYRSVLGGNDLSDQFEAMIGTLEGDKR